MLPLENSLSSSSDSSPESAEPIVKSIKAPARKLVSQPNYIVQPHCAEIPRKQIGFRQVNLPLACGIPPGAPPSNPQPYFKREGAPRAKIAAVKTKHLSEVDPETFVRNFIIFIVYLVAETSVQTKRSENCISYGLR